MKTEKSFPQNLHKYYENLNEVAYFEASVNYTFIHLKDGKKHLTSCTLKRFEEMLNRDHNFTRIHRSYIVNTSLITQIGVDNVILKSGIKLPISRRRRSIKS